MPRSKQVSTPGQRRRPSIPPLLLVAALVLVANLVLQLMRR